MLNTEEEDFFFQQTDPKCLAPVSHTHRRNSVVRVQADAFFSPPRSLLQSELSVTERDDESSRQT